MADLKLSTTPETKGSDEILEIFCEECIKEGNKVEVCAYCSDCDEYFCTICQKYHAKFLKDHKILDGDNVPKDVERCPVHKQIIKLYCSTCEKFACCMCTTHSSSTSAGKPCKLTSLAELSKDIEQSEELKNVITKLDRIVSTAEKVKQNESKLENIPDQAKQEVQKFKDKILAKVEQMNSEIDKRKQTDSDKLQTTTSKSNAFISKTKEVSNKIKQKHANVRTQRSQMFIVMKQMKSEIESLDKEMLEITTEMDQLNYIFEPDMRIIHITEEKQNFGTLTTKSVTTETKEVQMKKRKIAVHQYDIFDEDNKIKVCNFCVLPGQVLAICDSNDKSVKLFNASQKMVMATQKFNTTPNAIAYVGNSQFAVATADKITFILLSEKDTLLFKYKHFEVESECLDIIHVPDSDKQMLIVLLHNEKCNESKIQILDKSGRVLETYDTNPSDSTNIPLFSKFSWMTFDNKHNILYATDMLFSQLTTIHLDMEEENKDRIKQKFLLSPRGIACDSQGCIYASLYGHNKIIFYNPENGESQDLLTEKDNIFTPHTLKYCEEDNLLYVDNMSTIDRKRVCLERNFRESLEVGAYKPSRNLRRLMGSKLLDMLKTAKTFNNDFLQAQIVLSYFI